jgi:hypothetical protein
MKITSPKITTHNGDLQCIFSFCTKLATRGGRNVEFQNYYWPKISEHRKCLLTWSEHRKSKRSERRKWPTYGVLHS